jgi:hypothetical protein
MGQLPGEPANGDPLYPEADGGHPVTGDKNRKIPMLEGARQPLAAERGEDGGEQIQRKVSSGLTILVTSLNFAHT